MKNCTFCGKETKSHDGFCSFDHKRRYRDKTDDIIPPVVSSKLTDKEVQMQKEFMKRRES